MILTVAVTNSEAIFSHTLQDVRINLTQTCWQMLAYRASTLAFSKMASSDGVVSEIFSTQRHLAKSAPSFLYWAQRSDSPSRPAGTDAEKHTHIHQKTRRHSRDGGVASVSTASYPEWWSLRLSQRGARHLCPPVKSQTGNVVKQKHIGFYASFQTTWLRRWTQK